MKIRGGQASMGFMAAGGRFQDGKFSHFWDQKHSSFLSQNFSDNTNWETAAVHMNVVEGDIRKATGMVNAPL